MFKSATNKEFVQILIDVYTYICVWTIIIDIISCYILLSHTTSNNEKSYLITETSLKLLKKIVSYMM